MLLTTVPSLLFCNHPAMPSVLKQTLALDQELAVLARQSGQQAPGSLLSLLSASLPPQPVHALKGSTPASLWVLGLWTRVPMLAQHITLHTKPSPQTFVTWTVEMK